MEVIKTTIRDVLIIEPKVFGDERGYFFESFNAKEFSEKTGLDVNFVQDNESLSRYGVLRGLHFQLPPYTQSKLVRVVKGRVLDVVVDIRKGSPTYGQYKMCELTEENHRQFFVPKGMAHGFVVLSELAVFQYKCDDFYHPEAEGAIAWNDADVAIPWPIPSEDVILSEKDKHHPCLKDFDSPFSITDLHGEQLIESKTIVPNR